jgi:hypothetical protein
VGDFLSWMESSALGVAIRDAGPWFYAFINLGHILGIATLFGSILVLDLRLLGFWRRVPLAPLVTAADPIAGTGFAIAITTGVGLLATNATEYIGNPFLLIKFPAIAVGIVNVIAVHRSAAWRARAERELTPRETRQLRIMGGISLASWLTAVSAGRLIAYW